MNVLVFPECTFCRSHSLVCLPKDRQKDAASFAYSKKLPAYNGAFLLTVDNFSFFSHNWRFFVYNFSFLAYSWSFFSLQWESACNKGLKGL